MERDKILLGDTLTVLKTLDDNTIDLGITSPPYNKNLKGGPIVKKVQYDSFIDDLPEDEYQLNQIEVLNELYRTIKPGGSFFYNHRCRWIDGNMIHPITWLSKTNWLVKQEIIWNRSITGQLRGWRFWQTDERVYWLYKPDGKNKVGKELLSKHAKMTGIWNIMPENNNPHPAPFPIDLPSRIIYSMFDDEKDKLIIDPYFGSGTTGLASKLLGHNYIGIDMSNTYIEQAKERINNISEVDLKRFNNEISNHIITGMTYKERKEKKNKKSDN